MVKLHQVLPVATTDNGLQICGLWVTSLIQWLTNNSEIVDDTTVKLHSHRLISNFVLKYDGEHR